MTASDTVVGIAGSIVLVAVMVGVFVYEYNNAADAGGDPALVQSQQAFAAMHPNLDPNGDIDGDGIANHADADIDGDGIANADDDTISITLTFTGGPTSGIALNQADLALHSFMAQTGVAMVDVAFEGSGLEPTGLTADLSLDIRDPDGMSQPISPGQAHGSIGPAGSWDLTVRTDSVAVLATYSISVVLTY